MKWFRIVLIVLLIAAMVTSCKPCKQWQDKVITDVWTVAETGTSYYSVDYGPQIQIPQSKLDQYYVGKVVGKKCVSR